MFFRKIILVYRDNHTELQKILCEQNKDLINAKENVIHSKRYAIKVSVRECNSVFYSILVEF